MTDSSVRLENSSQSSLAHIRKNTLQFFSGTIFSRITGYFRDVAMAYSFGADPLIAIFLVGFRTSNLPRRLFGEGALQSILITQYQNASSQGSKIEGKKKMLQLQADCHKTWSLSLLGFIAIMILFLSALNHVAQSYQWFSLRYTLVLSYTCLMLPGLWFICMSALNDAFLKSQRRFLIGSCAPILFNLVWIGLSLKLRNLNTSQATVWLCIGIGFAYFTQWLTTYLGIVQEQRGSNLKGQFLSPNVKKLIKPIFQGIIGVGATQINGLLDGIFAMQAEASGPNYLWYALRIEQAPLALIGLAISSASLPALSHALEQKNDHEAKTIFFFAQKRMLTYMLGACSGMMCLAFIGVRLSLERGDFTSFDTYRTAQCLWGYSLGLMGQGIIFLYQNLAFCLHRYALATRSSLYAVGVNLILNFICVQVFKLSSSSIAVATTIATFVQLLILKRGIEKHFQPVKQSLEWSLIVKVSFLYITNFTFCTYLLCWSYQIPFWQFLKASAVPPAPLSSLVTFYLFTFIGASWLICHYLLSYVLRLPLPGVSLRKHV
jgi:putative peptidoglycan lipid II flippase